LVLLAINQPLVYLHVVVGHSSGSEALLEDFPTTFPADLWNPACCFYCIFQLVYDETGVTFFHYLGDCSTAVCDHRSPASHRFNHHEAKWLRPVDRQYQSISVSEKLILFSVTDLADNLDE